MREVTHLMVNEFKLKQLGHDFMGFSLQRGDIYTFHHLIVANRNNGPYVRWNGAILCGQTSHPYLHVIENKDYDMFMYLTSELIDINVQGYIDKSNLIKINDLLKQFESEHCGEHTRKGKILIKEEYTRRVIK